MKTRLTMAMICLVALSFGAQEGKQSRSDQAVMPTHFDFLMATIDSLARSHVAIMAVNAQSNASMVDRMTANKIASIELDIASRNLARFSSMKDDNASSAASGSVEAYGIIRKSLALQLAGYEKAETARSTDDLAGMSGLISDAKVTYQQGSRILIDATVLAFFSSVTSDPKDPNRVALNMTALQKAELLKALKLGFGRALTVKSNEDTGCSEAARIVADFLAKSWQFAK